MFCAGCSGAKKKLEKISRSVGVVYVVEHGSASVCQPPPSLKRHHFSRFSLALDDRQLTATLIQSIGSL